MAKVFALGSLVMVVIGCHGANEGTPASGAKRREEATAKAADNDNDDDDQVSTTGKQNPVPAAPTPAPAATGGAKTLAFDADKPDATPAGLTYGRTGKGAQGKWIVKAEADAPSGGKVLAQVDADRTDYRFPVAIASEPSLADLRLSVKCKPVSGKVDQACGLIFRASDPDNYYVTRANALEDNVRLYHVVKGDRKQFAGWNGKVKSGVWHDLRVDAKGDHFEVYFDGKKVIDANDSTFKNAGKIGLWTKADSVTYFDDLTVAPL
jgi:hypothetical protein